MIRKSLTWCYTAVTFLVWAVAAALIVTLLGLRYYVLPNVGAYKEVIAHEASLAAGQKITIRDIRARWDGLHPHLDLIDIALYDKQNRVALALKHVETTFSWTSLLVGEARLSRLAIHDPALTIRRDTDGTVTIAGISLNDPARPDFPNWLLRQSRIDVLNATVTWQDDLRGTEPLVFNQVAARIANPPWERFLGRHRFGLRATPAVGSMSPLDIRGSVVGKDVSRPENWSGTLYALLENTDVAPWGRWFTLPAALQQGRGSARFWLEFEQGQSTKLTTDVALADIVTQLEPQLAPLPLQHLNGRLVWQRTRDGNELRATRLSLATPDGVNLKDAEARFRTRLVAGQRTQDGEARLEALQIEQLATLLPALPVTLPDWADLQKLAPRGRLNQTRLAWERTNDNPATFTLDARFEALGANPHLGVPGFSGLNGTLEATQDGGALHLESTQTQLDFRDLLRGPIPVDKLAGQFTWKKQGATLNVKIARFALANPHLALTLDGTYKHTGNGLGDADLTGKVEHADGKFSRFYFPKTLSRDTLHWLDTSVLEGRGENFNIVLRGNLDEFPWADGKRGMLKISGKITDALLDYADGWPKIEGLHADLLFQGNHMEINASQGRLLGNRIIKTRAVIPALDAAHPVLEITGELNSPAMEIIQFINHSPVQDTLDRFTEGMQASGPGKLVLALQIPLDTEGVGSRVKGSYTLSNATLTGDADFPDMQSINGRLDFTESSLRAQRLQAVLATGPVQFGMESATGGMLRVRAQGSVSAEYLRRSVSHPLLNRIQGAAPWEAEIRMRKRQADLTLKSTLNGLAFNLPPPLDKPANASLPFTAERKLLGGGQDLVSLRLGQVLSAQLLRREQAGGRRVERGEVALGAEAALPAQPGLRVTGRVEHCDLDHWRAILEDAPRESAPDLPAIHVANLQFGSLDLFGRRINDLKLNLNHQNEDWRLELQSREVTGEALWQRSGNGKILARLKSLTFPAPAPAKLSAPDNVQEARQDAYPALDISAEQFEIRQKKLGRLELLATPQGSHWSIDRLRISNPDSTLTVDGEWRNWKNNPDTRLNLAWDITDVGKTLERFGYPDAVKGGHADLTGTLKWAGSPHEFNVPGLTGTLQLEAAHGQFLKIQPGVGRLFGVVSLQALPRRLTFDFRDVFNAGFAFDKITAGIRIQNSVLKSDDFVMEGPAAKVNIRGETNLERETQNLHIKVTPALTDSVALAAFAGGPAVGAAAWVAQKLLKDPLNKLASYEYDITGTWDDPQEIKPAEKTQSIGPTTLQPGKQGH